MVINRALYIVTCDMMACRCRNIQLNTKEARPGAARPVLSADGPVID